MTVTPLNAPWFALIVTIALLGVGAHLALRGRALDARRRALLAATVANAGFATIFHLAYLVDPSVHFPFWQNLPLHFCTIMSWLLIPTIATGWRPLQAVTFFPGAIAGILALVSCAPMYWGHALLSPKTFFFVAHELNAVIPFLMVSLGLFTPTVRDALLSVVYVAALGLLVLPVTLTLRAWADPGANYFYLFDPEGAEILEMLWSLIGIPIVYAIPLLVVILPILLLQVAVYRALSTRRPATPARRLAARASISTS